MAVLPRVLRLLVLIFDALLQPQLDPTHDVLRASSLWASLWAGVVRRVRAAPCPINLVQRDCVQQAPRRLAGVPLRLCLARHARRARAQTCNSRCQVGSAHLIARSAVLTFDSNPQNMALYWVIGTTTTGSSLVHRELYCVPACAALRLGGDARLN